MPIPINTTKSVIDEETLAKEKAVIVCKKEIKIKISVIYIYRIKY